MSGQYSIPFLFEHPSRITAFVPVAPVGVTIDRDWASVGTPLFAVYGERDGMGARATDILKHVPGATVHMIKGGSHPCYLDEAEEFNAQLVSFLQQLPR